jgi:transposase-like protein
MIVVLFHQFDEGDTTMAEGNSMTAREAASKVMALEHSDVLRESVAVMVKEIMEAEIVQLAGAELGERAPERRSAQRNGYRGRRWDTRVGEIELAIPKLRSGSYLPSSSSHAGAPSRRSWRSCRRPMSTASQRARSTA